MFRVAYDGSNVRSYDDVVRRGSVTVGGETTAFAIACPSGDCGLVDWVRVGFDLDADGTIDLDSQGSYERYTLRDRAVVLRGRTYDFSINATGDRLTLRPSAVAVPTRPTLRLGSSPPPFELSDGRMTWSLAAHKGKVVLIDFFSAGCHFCVEDVPRLARLHERYAGAGLEIVTIASEERPAGHPWPTFVEHGQPGPIAAQFRVDAYPAYFVIDRSGGIACTRCRHDDVARVLATLLP